MRFLAAVALGFLIGYVVRLRQPIPEADPYAQPFGMPTWITVAHPDAPAWWTITSETQ